jgi:hypothetical protein
LVHFRKEGSCKWLQDLAKISSIQMKTTKTEVEDGNSLAQKFGMWNELCTAINLSWGII